MPANDIGIDLGTTNSLVYSTGRGLVLSEPSVVVYDKDTEKIKAIGEEARQMAGHVTSNMEVICPIHQGMIIDFVVMEKMLKYFIAKAMGRRAFRKPRISVCVPSGITEIERKAVEEATYQAGAREVFLVEEPIAAAIGAGVDITKPFGNLIVDIGGGTTDIAVISIGGVVVSSTIKVAGDAFDQAIMSYIRKTHSLFIGSDTAEAIKNKNRHSYRRGESTGDGSKRTKCTYRTSEKSKTDFRRNPCGTERCDRTDRRSSPWSAGKDTAGTGR